MDLALNNLQRMICHKTKPNRNKVNSLEKGINPTTLLAMVWYGFLAYQPL